MYITPPGCHRENVLLVYFLSFLQCFDADARQFTVTEHKIVFKSYSTTSTILQQTY